MYKVYGNLHVKLFTIKNLFYLLLEIWLFSCFQLLMCLLPSEFFIEFGLPLRPRETDWRSGPGCWWSSFRSMKIGHWWIEGCVEFFFIVFIHWSRIWRPLLELVRNRISSIWLLFPEESFGYDLMNFVSFHNLMTWPHLLVEVISWVLVSVLYGGLCTCSVVSPFETSFSKSPCRRGLLGLLLFTPLWQSFV